MPLLKQKSEAQKAAITTHGHSPTDEGTTEAPQEASQEKQAEVSVDKIKAKPAMTKDDYWRNRENRDIDKDVRISRAGLFQAALQSLGLLQLNTGNTLEDYLKLIEQTCERGLEFVNRGNK